MREHEGEKIFTLNLRADDVIVELVGAAKGRVPHGTNPSAVRELRQGACFAQRFKDLRKSVPICQQGQGENRFETRAVPFLKLALGSLSGNSPPSAFRSYKAQRDNATALQDRSAGSNRDGDQPKPPISLATHAK
jgi:hypothetical protein